ncbi:MAG: XRE family transcriptional regulator [Nannocystaceae bacterium]
MISTQQLGARIAEARKAAGLTQAEVAERLGISRPTLIAVEKGKRRPSNTELVRFATILETSVHLLVRERTVSGGVSPRFRLSGSLSSPELSSAVSSLEALGRDYALLEQICDSRSTLPPLESVRTYHVQESDTTEGAALAGEQAAELVRSVLRVGNGPLSNVEDRLEAAAGLRIFFIKLPSKIAGIFIWGDEIRGCIGVNAAHPRERQRWTVMHEAGHYLRDREAGDVLPIALPRLDPSEAFAEAFARNGLLPSSGVSARFGERRGRGDGFTVADLVSLAHEFGVSFQAMCLRLEELGLLRRGTYDRLAVKRFQPENAKAELGLEPQTRKERMPRRFVQLALTAYEKAEISEGELANFLRIDRLDARRVYSEWASVNDGVGDQVQVRLAQDILGSHSDGSDS